MKIKKIKEVDYNFFDKFPDIKKFSNNEIENYSSIYNYYSNLIIDKNFEKMFHIIKDNLEREDSIFDSHKRIKIFKKNDSLLLFLYYFYNKNIEHLSIFYSSLIFNSFINKSDIVSKFEKSDIIISNSLNLLKNFFIFFDQKENINLDIIENDLIYHIFPLFEFLVLFGIIDSKLIIKRENGNFKTEKFWKLKMNMFKKINNFDIFLSEPILVKFKKKRYLVGGYYNKVYEIFKKNMNSGYFFELDDERYIESLAKLKWYVDLEWFSYIIKEINIYERIDNINIELELNNVISVLEKNEWSDSVMQKKYSKLILLKIIFDYYEFLKNIDINKPIYFAFFFDFRGRLYINSSVGITSNKILRTLYYYGYYTDINNYYNQKFEFLLILFEKEASKIIKKYGFVDNCNKTKLNIILVLLSIGRILTKKNSYKINISIYVLNAISYIENENNYILDIWDKVEIQHYIKIFKNNNKKKYVVLKDFTASFFQHLTRLLGPRSDITLKLSNMYDTENWYDPYLYIINKFLEKNNKLIHIDKFNRKSLKKVIMTIPYSIGFESAWKYFIDEISIDNLELKNLKKEFKEFFKFAKKMIESDYFFMNSSEKMILNAVTQAVIFKKVEINLKESLVNLIYYKKKIKRIDLIIKLDKNIRITKKINEIDKENIDFDGLCQSIRANWIATMDASFLRELNKNLKHPLFSIHDCVLVDWKNIDNIIVFSNNEMNINNFKISWNNNFKKNNFSIFIIF